MKSLKAQRPNEAQVDYSKPHYRVHQDRVMISVDGTECSPTIPVLKFHTFLTKKFSNSTHSTHFLTIF